MNQGIKLEKVEFIDFNGRLISHLLQRSVVYLSEVEGEIKIDSRHHTSNSTEWQAQVIARSKGCFLANWGKNDIEVSVETLSSNGSDSSHLLSSRAGQPIPYGKKVFINGRTLIFYRKRTASSIEVEFSLPEPAQLTESGSLRGEITLHNKGTERAVQFNVRIEGIGADCYDYPTPEKLMGRSPTSETIPFTIYHPADRPLLSGRHAIGVYATAEEYPGEEAADFQEIYVQPFYNHELIFEGEEKPEPPKKETEPVQAVEEKPPSKKEPQRDAVTPDDPFGPNPIH